MKILFGTTVWVWLTHVEHAKTFDVHLAPYKIILNDESDAGKRCLIACEKKGKIDGIMHACTNIRDLT